MSRFSHIINIEACDLNVVGDRVLGSCHHKVDYFPKNSIFQSVLFIKYHNILLIAFLFIIKQYHVILFILFLLHFMYFGETNLPIYLQMTDLNIILSLVFFSYLKLIKLQTALSSVLKAFPWQQNFSSDRYKALTLDRPIADAEKTFDTSPPLL